MTGPRSPGNRGACRGVFARLTAKLDEKSAQPGRSNARRREGRLSTHCSRFPHDTGWTAVDPYRTVAAAYSGVSPCAKAAIAPNWLGPSGVKRTAIHSECRLRYSMTSSARARTTGGIVRPSALAVFKLMISSYLVGCWTGRSAGFSPFRMRAVYSPAIRFIAVKLGP